MKLVNWLKPDSDKIKHIQISRAPNRLETYVDVRLLNATTGTGNNVTFVTEYLDEGGDTRDWYKITFLDDQKKLVSSIGPHQGQDIHKVQYEIMYRVRHKISDTEKPFVFPDWELLDELNQALLTHARVKTWEDFGGINNQSEQLLLQWLTISQVARVLAFDNSKYYSLSVDGKSVDKAARVEQYLKMADEYKKLYEEKREEWNVGTVEGSGEIKETYLNRLSFTTGRRAPFVHATPPEAITLYEPSHLTPTSADLTWTKSLDPQIYYYIIFRSKQPNVQTRLVTDAYNKRISLHDDPVDFQQNFLWGGITSPIKQIFRNSTTFWVDNDSNNQFAVEPYLKLVPGQRYYWITISVNRNLLFTISNEVTATLPELIAPRIYDPVIALEQSFVVQGAPGADITAERFPFGGSAFEAIETKRLVSGFGDTIRFLDVALVQGDRLRARQSLSFSTGFPAETSEDSNEVVVK